jgi:hypothetical protein
MRRPDMDCTEREGPGTCIARNVKARGMDRRGVFERATIGRNRVAVGFYRNGSPGLKQPWAPGRHRVAVKTIARRAIRN